MKLKSLFCTLALALGVTSGHAALLFADSPNDADSVYGSTESILGLGLIPFVGINGTSSTFFLESLDPGLGWTNFSLTVYDGTTEFAAQSPAATASINGFGATSVSFAPSGVLPPELAVLGSIFNVYTFSFANLVLGGNTNNTVTLAGFNTTFFGEVADIGGAVLTATAVPEPSTVALLMAGFAAMGWVARRKNFGQA